MFGWFRKKPPPSAVRTGADIVYADDASRAAAVVEDVQRASAAGRRVSLLTPFRGHIPSLRERLLQLGLPTFSLDSSYRDAEPPPDAVYLVDGGSVARWVPRLTAPQDFIQIERHPLRSHDEAMERAIEASSTAHRLRTYLSLDDGLFTFFDQDGAIKKLMSSMDMSPREPIEHRIVTSSIEGAQAKIAKKVRTEISADTFDAWRSVNLAAR